MVAKNPLVRFLYVFAGLLLTALGALGAVLPILPTTPFILLAGFCFVKSSERLHRWLMNHPKLGPGIHRIRNGQGIPLKTKVLSTGLAALTLGSFALWGTTNLHARIALVVVLTAKIIAMVKIPTYKPQVEPEWNQNSPAGSTTTPPFRITLPLGMTLGVFLLGTGFVLAQTFLALGLGAWAFQLIGGNVLFPSLVLGLVGLRWIFMLANRYLASTISQSVRKETRAVLYRELGFRGSDEIREMGQGVLHELLNDKVEALDPLYSLYVPQLWIGILSPLVALGVMVYHDWFIAAGLFLLIPLAPLILGILRKRFQVVGGQYSAAASDLGSWYVESIRAIPTLTLFQRVSSYSQKLFRASSRLRDKTIGLLAVNQLALLLVELFFSLSLLLVATALGYFRYQEGHIGPAFALALPFLVIELIRPINLVGAFFFAGAAGRQAKKSLEEYANRIIQTRKQEYTDWSTNQENSQALLVDIPARGLVIRDLGFSYPNAPEKQILQGFNLTVEPGEIVGLQGPSGSGKTTLAKLILGFHTPCQGGIFLDGQNVARMSQNGSIGYLPQRPYVFSGSLRENIQMGNTALSDEDIRRALEAAGIGDFIRRGLDTPLGEDAARISGGERLRIALARVFAQGSSYIVLDEPTAELDSLSEFNIWTQLRSTGLGVLLIAHRRSTLEGCTRIVSLQGVRV